MNTPPRARRVSVANAAMAAKEGTVSALSAIQQKIDETFKAGALDLNEETNADLVIARHLWLNYRLLPPISPARCARLRTARHAAPVHAA